jgi:predicted MFS family arabinose efflux permease
MIGGRVIDSAGLSFLGFAAAGFILLSVFLAMVLMTLKPREECAQTS